MKTILKKIIFGTLTFTSLSSCGQSAKKIEQMEEKAKTLTGLATATFGTGCFWCTEAVYQLVNGVIRVKSGYMGGSTPNPTYAAVCEGNTGHAECVQIEYDPAVITFDALLEIFWNTHDPTTLNRQGNDVGTQYRSVIFYHSDAQMATAEAYIRQLNSENTCRPQARLSLSRSVQTNLYEQGHSGVIATLLALTTED